MERVANCLRKPWSAAAGARARPQAAAGAKQWRPSGGQLHLVVATVIGRCPRERPASARNQQTRARTPELAAGRAGQSISARRSALGAPSQTKTNRPRQVSAGRPRVALGSACSRSIWFDWRRAAAGWLAGGEATRPASATRSSSQESGGSSSKSARKSVSFVRSARAPI